MHLNKYLNFFLCSLIVPGFLTVFSSGEPEHVEGTIHMDHDHATSSFQFIENKGQWDSDQLYKLDLGSVQLRMFKDKMLFTLLDEANLQEASDFFHSRKSLSDEDTGIINGHNFFMSFLGANENVEGFGNGVQDGYRNYFIGSNSSKWASQVRSYGEAGYSNLYNGIDLKVYELGGNLKYDYIVAPNADPNQIRVEYEHADAVSLIDGKIYVVTSTGEIVEQAPVAYQMVGGLPERVACDFVLEDNILSFEFSEGYDDSKELIIDPELIFGSYTGATGDNWGISASFDDDGHLYGGGLAFGDFPVTPGAFQTSFMGVRDMSISKFSPDGTTLVYSTYIGGNQIETPQSTIVNSQNQLVIFGSSSSSNYPVTADAYDITPNGSFDIVVTIVSEDGTDLIASTFVGGAADDGLNSFMIENYADDLRGSIELTAEDEIFIASSTLSQDFPATPGAFDESFNGGAQDAVVLKLNSDLSALEFATYIGGSGLDAGLSLTISEEGSVYVCGNTDSDFPTTPGALNETQAGFNWDAFVARFAPDLGTLEAGTYVGTEGRDLGLFLQTDRDGSVYLLGSNLDTDYPTTGDVYENPGSTTFIQKMDDDLTTSEWATVVGNMTNDKLVPSAFLIDNCGRIYFSAWGGALAGFPSSTNNLPLGDDPFQASTDGQDYYLMVLTPGALDLEYATYYGGSSAEHVDGGTSRFDKNGIVYQAVCAGCGGLSDFPTTEGAVSQTNNSTNCNLGVFRFDFEVNAIGATIDGPASACPGDSVTITTDTGNEVAEAYEWSTGDTTADISFILDNVFDFSVTIYGVCGDDAVLNFSILEDSISTSIDGPERGCPGDTVTITTEVEGEVDSYEWNTGDTTSSITVVLDVVYDFSVTITGCGEQEVQTWSIDNSYCCEDPIAYYSLDACDASQDETPIYEEFEPEQICLLACSDVVSSIVFRDPGATNRHSCTPGVSEAAMCVSALDDCEYQAGSEKSIVFEITVNPEEGSVVRIESLQFYEKAPEEFDWINGEDGPNNYPTLYGLRIVKDGDEVFNQSGIETTIDWSLEEFNFDDLVAIEECTFRFELLAYCLVDNGADVNAWDIDEISVFANCEDDENFVGDISGFIATPYDVSFPDNDVVLYDILSQDLRLTQTDESGAYIFENIEFGSDYRIIPDSKSDYLNGVSTYDIVQIQKHLLGAERFESPFELIAADANGSETISALDIVELRKLLLGYTDQLPVNSWRFVESTAEISIDNAFNFEERIDLMGMNRSELDNDFTAVKVGDLNGSAEIGFVGEIEDRTDASIEVFYEWFELGGKSFVALSLTEDMSIEGLQLDIEFSGAIIESLEARLLDLNLEDYRIESNRIRIIKAMDRGIELKKGDVFATVKLGANQRIISIENTKHAAALMNEIYTLNGEQREISWRTKSETNPEILPELIATPNPFSEQVVINYTIDRAGTVLINVLTADGKYIFSSQYQAEKGLNQILLNRENLGNKAGIYFFEITKGEESKRGKLILVD